MRAALDLSTPLRVHVVGIGGAGMSAIATVLVAMGHRVSGSDLKASPGLERLRALGVEVAVGHAADHVGDVDVVTISTAVPAGNVEVAAAQGRGIPVLRRAELLAAVARTRRTVAVAGTHGKTTTASMLALVLVEAGLRPSFIIGGELNEIGTGAVWDGGEWFVVEADESDGTFLELGPEAAVVTNVEPDHLEHYGGFEPLVAAFDRFLAEAPGPRVLCADDDVAARLAREHDAVSYGTAAAADYRMVDVRTGRSRVRFVVERGGSALGEVALPVPGLHNARNACGALVAGLELGATFDAAARALARYGGVARRFQFRGEREGVTFVDDYAHLPTEVRAALATARDGGWNRVVAVFQPHRFSRTQALWPDFADAFVDADVLVLTDVYAAGEAPRPGVSGKLLVYAVLDAHSSARVAYLPTRPELVAYLRRLLRPGDVCLTLGAGDLTSLPDELLERSGGEFPAKNAGNSPPERGGGGGGGGVERAAAVLGDRARRDVPLGPRTTYRVGGAAALFVEAHGVPDLLAVGRAARESGLPVLVVGKGSNLLVADAGFEGIAVTLGEELAGIEIDGTRVRAGAAAALPVVARRTAAAGLTGFEWAVGVPGSVGGAVRMNAGGHGSDMSECVELVEIVDLGEGVERLLTRDSLAYGYRRSSIAANHVVLWADLVLAPGDRATSEAAIAEIVRWRREHQPGGQNAGSVFTNPPGDSAGRLVDAAGLKGFRVGSAHVSTKHANFVQADEGGSADDVLALVREVQRRVEEQMGVRLEPELRLVGFE